jgi:hypothetical protein
VVTTIDHLTGEIPSPDQIAILLRTTGVVLNLLSLLVIEGTKIVIKIRETREEEVGSKKAGRPPTYNLLQDSHCIRQHSVFNPSINQKLKRLMDMTCIVKQTQATLFSLRKTGTRLLQPMI